MLDHPPLLDAIAGDPLLPDLKLVAWVGDAALLPRNGQRGFPHGGVWLERNTRFTRDFLQYLAEGHHGKASAIATRFPLPAPRSPPAAPPFCHSWIRFCHYVLPNGACRGSMMPFVLPNVPVVAR